MARILVKGQWYEEISSAALYESDFERLVFEHSALLFPAYVTVPFKRLVSDGESSAKPDLALIHVEYREWWVVEVEMAHHSLTTHVAPQVKTLVRAHYGREEARHLCEQSALLDENRLCTMIKGTQPKVIVVVNMPKPEWKAALAPYGVLVAVMEIFRSDFNEFIYRVNGEIPAPLVEAVSRCHLDRLVPRLLLVQSPGILTAAAGERISIEFQNGRTEWVRVDAADRVWLHPVRNNPLLPDRTYTLSRTEAGTFVLRETQGQ